MARKMGTLPKSVALKKSVQFGERPAPNSKCHQLSCSRNGEARVKPFKNVTLGTTVETWGM
jgi:hypothetical protein